MPDAAASGPAASFGTRLRTAMQKHGQLCVGIDPHPALLESWGLNDDADGLERFSLTVLEAVGDGVAARAVALE
ncbi:MAG TPA: orotidine 5'-phosphate decarboxylase, partial [Arthrobacter sp.]|nr:orotidine 5'-phosphate decarboxylase [Arthrobacter sp.]